MINDNNDNDNDDNEDDDDDDDDNEDDDDDDDDNNDSNKTWQENWNKTVEGQNKGCAYCYRATGDNPKRLVGHLESIGVNLDVAPIQKSAS